MSVVVVVGDVDADHVVTMQQTSLRLFEEHGYSLTLVDAREAGTMTPEARRASAEHQRQYEIPGSVAIFGIGVILRAMIALYSRTVALFAKTKRETALFQTEAEARAWIDAERLRLRAGLVRTS